MELAPGRAGRRPHLDSSSVIPKYQSPAHLPVVVSKQTSMLLALHSLRWTTGEVPLTESCITRTSPKFKQTEIMLWDEAPVPVGTEFFSTTSHRGAEGNRCLHRERPDLSSWALVGDGNRRQFELGTGWDCALRISLADGLRGWSRASRCRAR